MSGTLSLGTVHNHCALSCFAWGDGLTILKPLYMHIGVEQISRWMADNESQVSYCWSEGYR